MRFLSILAAFAFCLIQIHKANAVDFDVYLDRNAFIAALQGDYQVIDFDNLSPGIQPSGELGVSPYSIFAWNPLSTFTALENPNTPGDIGITSTIANLAYGLIPAGGNTMAMGGNFYISDSNGNPIPGNLDVQVGNTGYLTNRDPNFSGFFGFISKNNTPISIFSVLPDAPPFPIGTFPPGFIKNYAVTSNLIIGKVTPVAVPEPSTYILIAIAACTIAIISRQTKSNLK